MQTASRCDWEYARNLSSFVIAGLIRISHTAACGGKPGPARAVTIVDVPASRNPRRGWFRAMLMFLTTLIAGFYLLCLAELVVLRWLNPPTTAVQVQRRIEVWAR